MIEIPEGTPYLWRNSYLKIWSLGKTLRALEISTYPRAYKDNTPHVYSEDTPFIVTKEDYNFRGEYPNDKYSLSEEKFIDHGVEHTRYGFLNDKGKFVTPDKIPKQDLVQAEGRLDTKLRLSKEGETGYHCKGEPLPGLFPRWLEKEEDIVLSPDIHTLDFTGMPFPADILEVEVNRGDGWKPLNSIMFQNFDSDFRRKLKPNHVCGWFEGKVTLPKFTNDPPKILLRILYKRELA